MKRQRTGAPSRSRVDAVATLCQMLVFAFLLVAKVIDTLVQFLAALAGVVPWPLAVERRRRQGQQNTRGHGTKPKMPRVASIVVTETESDKVPLERVADLVIWCLQAGISYLFVYDPKGEPC